MLWELDITSVAGVLITCLFYARRETWLRGIPIQEGNNFFLGFTNFVNEKAMRKLLKEKGPLVQFKVLNRKILFIADGKLAKTALRDIQGKGFFHNATPKIVPDSIFSVDTGPEWQLRRNAFRKAFSNMSLRAHTPSITKLNEKLCRFMEEKAKSGEIFAVDDAFTELTIGVICEVAFEMDAKAFDHSSGYCQRIDEVTKYLFEKSWIRRLPFATELYYSPMYPFDDYRRTRDKYNAVMRSLLHHVRSLREQGALREDSLAMAMLNFSDLQGVREDQVVSEISTFFIGGMDTTAHTLSFMIYCLARYPEVQRKCQEELGALAGGGGDAVLSVAVLPPYTEAVLKESMRLYPTAAPGSIREVREPGGYQLTEDILIPQGWWVQVNLMCLQTYVGNWGDTAEEFIPERWMDNREATDDKAVDPLDVAGAKATGAKLNVAAGTANVNSPAVYAGYGRTADELDFAPFSFGVRNCIGMNLALMELRITLVNIISRFHFDLGDASMMDDNNLLHTTFTMHPQRGLPIKITRRN